MAQKNPNQANSTQLTQSIRAATKRNQLQNVLEAAGASEIEGEAPEVLGEASAAQIAELAAQGRIEASEEAPAPEAELVEAAKAAFDHNELEAAFQQADMDPQQGQQAASREMARIAGSAAEFAEAEDRPVCHNCSAVGAVRAASQLSAPQQHR